MEYNTEHHDDGNAEMIPLLHTSLAKIGEGLLTTCCVKKISKFLT